MAESLLTVAQVARLVGVPLDCARQWVESGQLPSAVAPDGRDRLVRRTDLDAFITANNMPPLPAEGSPDGVEPLLAALPTGLRHLTAGVAGGVRHSGRVRRRPGRHRRAGSEAVPAAGPEDKIRKVALPLGLVGIKVCAVSELWPGLKLVIRKGQR